MTISDARREEVGDFPNIPVLWLEKKLPKKSWDEVVKEDMKKRDLCINDAQDRNKWR